MSSEKTYLLEGRPYEVFRAHRILSPHFQTGWFATQILYVRVPEEKMGLLRQLLRPLKPLDSLRIRELADGAKYRPWAKAQVKKHSTPEEKGNQRTEWREARKLMKRTRPHCLTSAS